MFFADVPIGYVSHSMAFLLFQSPYRSRFHRSQHFHRISDSEPINVCIPGKRGIGGEALQYVPKDDWNARRSGEERKDWSKGRTEKMSLEQWEGSNNASGNGNERGLASWIKKDKQVLRFFTYFTEMILDQGVERDRIRKCHLLFFLEDDSIQILEPTFSNSGIPQGTLMRRHRVPFTYVKDRELGPTRSYHRTCPKPHITYRDLNLRQNILIYGRLHRIVDCDTFTRDFLTREGISVPDKEPAPFDVFKNMREKIETVKPLRPYKRLPLPKEFGPLEGKVLRFFGKWEDKNDSVGEIRHFSIHLHLEDETIEIIEIHDTNCGRYRAPTFLKRCRLPKSVSDLVPLPGHSTDHTLLNVVRSKGPGRVRDTILIDNLETKSSTGQSFDEQDKFYQMEDFDIGKEIQVAGRQILIYDCDRSTRLFYQEHLSKGTSKDLILGYKGGNFKTSSSAMEPLEAIEVPKPKQSKSRPPYNGFGTEPDSLTSCNGLEPRPPQRDFYKFMHKDRDGFESHILRFSARLVENDKVDTTRRFILSYHLSDDTILINQFPDVNSGVPPGRFLLRCRVKKPPEMQDQDLSVDTLFYSSEDLFVGAVLKINEHWFILTEADEYVFNFMEQFDEREKYPHSNIRLILEKLDGLLDASQVKHMMAKFMDSDPTDRGIVLEQSFRSILNQFIPNNLSEHEIITLVRHLQEVNLEARIVATDTVFSLLQMELKRMQFSAFPQLILTLESADLNAEGVLPKSKLRNVLVAACCKSKTTLRGNNIRDLIDECLKSYSLEFLDYREFVNRLDWLNNPSKPVPPSMVPSNFFEHPLQSKRAPIEYRKLIRQLEAKKNLDISHTIDVKQGLVKPKDPQKLVRKHFTHGADNHA
ncbi:EF-hand domain-containing family member C2-like isoform X1 [Tigriopus californicus]|uniref:EF-hand domain-containing family member C2-like isoform X1 n=1 Tax=Tigriopus californicus TaxID=6832 RepID=UPI0027DA6A50|nr:EF-hand domain-containing family member C2-like isoform X1 [Tigriopus californicus]